MAELSLDHVGAIVRDLDLGAERWRRLGFRLAPRSPQMGFDWATGEIEPWATANHCAIFHRGYLELIGVIDPDRFNPWEKFLNRFEGAHITALRCPNADTAYAEISARTEGFDPPLDRRRNAPYQGSTREMRFRNIFSRDDAHPEGRFIIIEHQTPELIWQEDLMDHPNGAIALEEVVFRASDPAPTARRIAAIVGTRPFGKGDEEWRFELTGGGALEVLSDSRFADRFPDVSAPPSPSIASCTIAVQDLHTALNAISAGGVSPLSRGPNEFSIAPADGNGLHLLIRERG